MQIDRIDLYHVEMPLKSPWRTAYGEDVSVHSVLCRMSSGSADGWGESSPLAAPCYSSEWAGGVFQLARDWLAPALLGKHLESGAQLQSHLSCFKGNPFAKAVLDNAWWSLHSNLENKPLHEVLGGRRDAIAVGADFGVGDDPEALLADIGRAVDDGFPRVKLKFRPGWDLPIVEAVRRQHPDLTFHIDCNSGYRIGDLGLFQELDQFDLAMVEQPLAHDDLIDHARLQSQVQTPVCLDESIVSLEKTTKALELGSCRFVNVKPGRVGGLTNAVAIHDLCRDAGVPCWVGGMLESGTGAAACTALATLDNFTYPADIFPSSRFYAVDLADEPLELTRVENSKTPMAATFDRLPEPDARRLKDCTRQSATIQHSSSSRRHARRDAD